jgi:predicted DNA-binding transcriptional regulator YafY
LFALKTKIFAITFDKDGIMFQIRQIICDNFDMISERDRIKKDRLARLVRLVNVLFQNPRGLAVKDIADKCGVSLRTAYRDLEAIETEMDYKIWEDGTKRGLVKDQFLPPISFSHTEALNIFFASRLMLSYTQRNDPYIASIFTKLATIVSPNLQKHIQETLDWMQSRSKDDAYLKNIYIIAESWIKRLRVKIWYRSYNRTEAVERIIEPYFIEPFTLGHTSYIVAYCHLSKEIRTFKFDRIESLEMTDEEYFIPDDFNANEFFAEAWGITVGGEVKTIRLKFSNSVSRIITETCWHKSQNTEPQRDGTVVLTMKLSESPEFTRWVLSWGENVEVLEPDSLRKEVTRAAMKMVGIYSE